MKEIIINHVLPIVVIVLLYCVSYLLTKMKITEKVTGVINKAEKEYENARKSGIEKMNFAIDLLYDKYVPVYLKPFITKELIKTLIQKTFNEAEKYAKSQLDKVADVANDKIDKTLKIDNPHVGYLDTEEFIKSISENFKAKSEEKGSN